MNLCIKLGLNYFIEVDKCIKDFIFILKNKTHLSTIINKSHKVRKIVGCNFSVDHRQHLSENLNKLNFFSENKFGKIFIFQNKLLPVQACGVVIFVVANSRRLLKLSQ